MTRGAANTLWARAWVDELARAGVREVALAPGSRSTPLVLAFARDERIRVRVHMDERSAGFYALGVGKASGRPGVVLTTSGTAVANLYPAVVEAAQAEVPLVVLTADRPARLRGADANQAVDQVRAFGVYPRAFFETIPAVLDPDRLAHLRTTACRAVAEATGPPPGPVHVNFPFEKPFEPDEGAVSTFSAAHPRQATGRPNGARWVEIQRGRPALEASVVERWAATVGPGRGLIVAGPVGDPDRVGPAVRALAERSGFPLLADPLSGARFGDGGRVLRPAGYDLWLRDREVRAELRPDHVIRVGASPTSTAVVDWLAELADTPCLVVDDGERWKDHAGHATHYAAGDPVQVLGALSDPLEGATPEGWRALWEEVDRVARTALTAGGSGEADQAFPEGALWRELAAEVSDATVFVSSSMPVRDMDGFAVPADRRWRVLGNRGASGIDGIVSTAFGVSAARGGSVLCVLGDLALFHDQNGLLWSREPDLAVVFILVDNDGGGIFHLLPVATQEPFFTPYFATPHGLDFRHVAALHGIELRDVTVGTVAAAAAAALASGETVLLRLRTTRVPAARTRAERAGYVARSVREALNGR